nr:hypothetical protein [Limosilactobacillus sp.]
AVTPAVSTKPAYQPVTDESNPHRSNVVPNRATTTPDYDNENGDRYGKLVDDYKIGWVRQQLASRPNDPGFVLSDDGLTVVYRVSAGDTTDFKVNDILDLLYAQNVENPSQVIWGTDKRYAENGQTDDNGIKWQYKNSYRYFANGTQVQVLDIVDKKRIGDFSMDLSPAKYATAPTTTELVVPGDDDSNKVHYPGAVIKNKESNVNYYADPEMKKGYLIATNRVANRMGYAQDFVGLQTLRFAIVPVNAAPWINIPATAEKMGLGNAPYNDQENKVEYYQAADVAGLKNIIKDNMVVKDYMDDYAGLPVKDTTLKIVDEAGKEVTPDQMKENSLYTVVMTATDNGDLVTHDSFNVVAGKLPVKSAAPT